MICNNCHKEIGDVTHCPYCNYENETREKPKKDKKKLVVILVIVCAIAILTAYFLWEFFFPRISLQNMKEEYTGEEFIGQKYEVRGSLFVRTNKTVWNINGYDFYQGKSPAMIPATTGKNTLTITNGKATKTYEFTVSKEGILLQDNTEYVNADETDYDGDGIPNQKEKELGLSTYTNDTDGDGLYDNVELIMGLDPKKEDNYYENRTFTVLQDNSKNKKNYVEVTGKGNIANTFLDTTKLNVGYDYTFVRSEVLSLVTSNKEEPEKLTIYFERDGRDLDTFAIYEYDPKENVLKEKETEMNEEYFYADADFNFCYFLGNKNNVPTGEYKNQIMILIDNSGSMYTKDYVSEKMDQEISEDDSNYGNDIEFKRISLMKTLVERLGTEKYEYSVYAFTSDFCDIVSNSKEKDTILNGMESLKTNCQNFTGTDMSGAIRNYVSKFDMNAPGIKYLIVLTDGQDTGFFTFPLYKSNYNNYLSKGIRIITVGLGQGVNSDYLEEIAKNTNGAYFYASDASMLESLIHLIENSIQNQTTTTIDDKEVTLVADSGFDVSKDGFSFANFGSQDTPYGNCYGFSYLTKLIYLNKLPNSAEAEAGTFPLGDDNALVAYTLTDLNKTRLMKGQVANITLDPYYSMLLQSDLPEDYRDRVVDGIPYIKEEYANAASLMGYTLYVKKVSQPVEIEVNGEKGTYTKYQSTGDINLFDAKVDDKYYDDYQVLQLINRYFRIQKRHFVDALKEKIEITNQKNGFYDFEKQVKKTISELKTGSPALITIECAFGSHSVLATKVYKSNDLEEYIMGIYDSNEPLVEQQAHFTRQTSYVLGSESSYYSFDYEAGGYQFKEFLYSGEY